MTRPSRWHEREFRRRREAFVGLAAARVRARGL